MTDIILKHGTGVPSGSDLDVAEVAIDSSTGDMYTKLADLSVKQLNEGGASSWNDLTDRPVDFPPEAHSHDIDDVNGLQDALDAAGGAPAWDDVTGKPTEFPPEAHQHGWDDVTGKPADYPPSAHGHAWDEITGKPAEFPPASHNHDGVYQPVGNYIEDANSDGKQYARQDGAWSAVSNGFESISGDVGATGWGWRNPNSTGQAGVFLANNGNAYCPSKANHISLGTGTQKWKDIQMSGTAYATDFVASSDERLKDNITTAPVGLIDSLKGREWDWSESGEKGSGVVAQELEQVLPHLVHTDDEGMKSVSYNGLIAYLIEEVKDLKAQVDTLKNG